MLAVVWLLPSVDNEHEPESTGSPFAHLSAHCAGIPPIQPAEFFARQHSLAKVLHEIGGAAYVAEPGANAQFFGNISSSKWHLSERPLLLVVTADSDGSEVTPRLSVLTPTFEATRAKLLPVPAELNITYVDWPEDANPYEITANSIIGKRNGKIFVDNSIRKFIADGLASALPDQKVESAPLEITTLRERKSPAELDVLRCANEVSSSCVPSVCFAGIRFFLPGNASSHSSGKGSNEGRDVRVRSPGLDLFGADQRWSERRLWARSLRR